MSIAQKAVKGAAWTVATSVASRLIGLVGTLLIVRYLDPDDYGVVSAASVLVATANQFSTLGIGIYLIAHRDAGREAAFHATFLHLFLGVLALLPVVLFASWLGPLFDAPTVTRYVPGLALAVMFDRISFLPERILVRDMGFRTVGLARSAGEVAYTLVSVGTAMAGWGGGAVVAGNVARSLVRMVWMVVRAERREWLEVCRLRWAMLVQVASYGVTVAIGGLASFASRRWDNLLVSRFFGPAVMGAYNVAYNLADIPTVGVGEQITDVLLSSFVNMPDGPEKRRSLLRALELLMLIMAPMAVGLGVVAPTVVETFFPGRWGQVAPMLMVLAVLSVPRPVTLALGAYMQSRRKPGVVAALDCAGVVLLLTSIVVASPFGPLAACGAVGVVFTLRSLANMVVLAVTEEIPVRSQLATLVRPLLACLPMAAAVLAVRWWTGHSGLHVLQMRGVALGLEMLTGGVVFAASALLIARRAAGELIRLGRKALKK